MRVFSVLLIILSFPLFAVDEPGRSVFSESEQLFINEHQVIEYTMDAELPPLIRKKNGKSEGIIPDMIELISHHTGIDFVEDGNGSRGIHFFADQNNPALENYLFTTPYMEVPFVIISRSPLRSDAMSTIFAACRQIR